MSGIFAAGIAHAGVMAALHAAAFPDAAWDTASFAALLAQPGTEALLDPHGGVVLWRCAADEAEILTIGVAERRCGIGMALMRAAIARARAAGAAAVFLDVAAGNAAALGLYGRLGFLHAGRRKGYYAGGEDAVMLRLDLPEV